FYLLGFGKFLLTLLSFKLLGFLSYIISLWALYKIAEKKFPKHKNLSLTIFAFNPLVLIEMLVTAHLDALMTALMLVGIALVVYQKKISGVVALVISAAIKYVSASVIVPIFLLSQNR